MTGPAGVTAQLGHIVSAVDYLAELENQDSGLVIAMSRAMLGDVIDGVGLRPLDEYARRYCDVIDTPADAERIAAGMRGED